MNGKLTRRVVWVSLLLLVFLGAGAGYLRVVADMEEERSQHVADEVRIRAYQDSVGVLVSLAAKAETNVEWEAVRTRAATLPPEFDKAKGYFTRLSTVRIIEDDARRRDQLFKNAGELLSANENDPEAARRLGEAKALHAQIEGALKKVVSDPKYPEWNQSLEYRKAYEAYRSLAFLEKGEHAKALDIIADAVGNLGKSLVYREKDNRTERAIEFLYKRAKEEEEKAKASGAGNTPVPGRPRGLPSRGQDGPGTGGDDRPRRH